MRGFFKVNISMKDTNLTIFLLFLKFGFLAWGGPVAQIAMIRDELVERRQWITHEKFLRVLAIYQALPGPEAHELCVYFGMIRTGRLGGFLAGLGFMLPGFILILALGWLYNVLGPDVLLPLLVGIAPAVTALVVRAIHRLGSHTLLRPSLFVIAVVSAVLTLFKVHFFLVFLVAVAAQFVWNRYKILWGYTALIVLSLGAVFFSFVSSGYFALSAGADSLFVSGLKAGILSFGGAYTAIPFLRDSMVGIYPAITMEAFLDGLALSNVIPAPLVIFGTFLGYLAGGLGGAFLITLGIFLPAFSFTLIGHKYLEKIAENPLLHTMLNAIAASVIGLLFVTVVEIAIHTLTGIMPVVIFAGALIALYAIQWKWATPAILLFFGIAGYFMHAISL